MSVHRGRPEVTGPRVKTTRLTQSELIRVAFNKTTAVPPPPRAMACVWAAGHLYSSDASLCSTRHVHGRREFAKMTQSKTANRTTLMRTTLPKQLHTSFGRRRQFIQSSGARTDNPPHLVCPATDQKLVRMPIERLRRRELAPFRDNDLGSEPPRCAALRPLNCFGRLMRSRQCRRARRDRRGYSA
jgi:hypothetical protein